MDRRAWFGRVARGGVEGGGVLGLSASLAFAAERAGDGVSGPDGVGAAGEGFDAALERLGASDAASDARLVVDVAAEAWSGAFVMVRVDASALDDVRALHVLRDAHRPASIVALAVEPGLSPPTLALPVRLERPCRVRALARTGGGWVRADGRVRTVGAPGCG